MTVLIFKKLSALETIRLEARNALVFFVGFLKKSEVSFATAQEPLAGGQWLHVRHALALFAQEFSATERRWS